MAKKQRRPKAYDTAMIRDFLHHLLWELKLAHFVDTHAPGATNEELREKVRSVQSKYPDSPALVPVTMFRNDGVSKAEALKARRALREAQAEKHQMYIDALEDLEPAIGEAIRCANSGAKFGDQESLPAVQFNAREILSMLETEGRAGL